MILRESLRLDFRSGWALADGRMKHFAAADLKLILDEMRSGTP